MVKNKKSSRNGIPQNNVRVQSRFNSQVSINPSTAATNLGELSTSNTGMWALDSQVSSLSDMFRFFKINSVAFELVPNSTTSATAVSVPPGTLYFKMLGQNAPTSLADLESPMQGNITLPWGTGATVPGESLVKECVAKLKLLNKDLPILQGPSTPGDAGYLVTQDDGTQTSYGTMFWMFFNTVASTTLAYVLRTYFDISFKDILDPASISAAQAERASAAVTYHCQLQARGATHIQFSEGCLEAAIMLHVKVPRPLPATGSSPTPSSDASLAQKWMRIQQLKIELKALEGPATPADP